MILLTHYMLTGFTNGYVVADHRGGTACLINPGSFDAHLLETLETHELYPSYVLVTTPEPQHTRGIETLRRIYNTTVCAAGAVAGAPDMKPVTDGEVLRLDEMQIHVIGLPTYRPDAVAYAWGRLLFPGNVLQAGTIVMADDLYATVDLRTTVRERLLSLPGDTVVLPSLGPPTTVETELATNIDVATAR
ncbi:MAG: hypothetical protein ACLFO1_00265 [Spirochaetaceae bacterium]